MIRIADLGGDSQVRAALDALKLKVAYSLPLMLDDQLQAVIVIEGQNDRANALLAALQTPAAIALNNAQQYTHMVIERDGRMQELELLRKIDRELSDIVNERGVYDFTLDWVMRVTLAHAASLILYDPDTGSQEIVTEYGYTRTPEQLARIRAQHDGIAGRVARSARPEIVSNTADDPGYLPLQDGIRSHLSVPVLREDRVIAVITAESRRLNAFTEAHLDFVVKLAARAGVAIDNARLYDAAVREREQLAHILRSITDVVIVVDQNDRIVLINAAALSVFHLPTNEDYTGRTFDSVFKNMQLNWKYRRAKESRSTTSAELALSPEAIYYANFAPVYDVGWIIVMRDITPLKTTDQLKHELISLTSHDLKQPLTVISAYIELLQLRLHDLAITDPETRLPHYIEMAQNAIKSMQDLIGNLINLASIESGILLNMKAVRAEYVISECMSWIKSFAEQKHMQLITHIPDGLPAIAGDAPRLIQVFNNIVGNAVKYTPPDGTVRVTVERQNHHLRFTVSDNGVGIRPQDQPHVFERFYRARRPETESIEGSGLGLAIVKKLVDLHDGEIGLQSELGVGTTFYVTLPIYDRNLSANSADNH